MSDWTQCDAGEYECSEYSATQFWIQVGNADSGGFLIMSPIQAMELGQALLAWAQPKFGSQGQAPA